MNEVNGPGSGIFGNYPKRFAELADSLGPPPSYYAGEVHIILESLARDLISDGRATLDQETLARLCRSLGTLLDLSSEAELLFDETGRSVEEINRTLDEADSIIAGRYEQDQDRLLTLAAAILNLLAAPSPNANKLAAEIVQHFLLGYGPPPPLEEGEINNGTVRLMAMDAGLLPDDQEQPVVEPQDVQT